jgi:hypothetical protein
VDRRGTVARSKSVGPKPVPRRRSNRGSDLLHQPSPSLSLLLIYSSQSTPDVSVADRSRS